MNKAIIYTGYRDKLPVYCIPSMPLPVVLHHCVREHDYEDGLKTLWKTPADLVIIEHDVMATPEQVASILLCPYISCAYAYWLYPTTTGGKEPVIAHRRHDEFIKEGDQFADSVGFGFTKLSKYVRQEITEWNPKGSWRNLDERVSAAFREEDYIFHIHWPTVEHQHRE